MVARSWVGVAGAVALTSTARTPLSRGSVNRVDHRPLLTMTRRVSWARRALERATSSTVSVPV
jgi:hypothetical protein